MKRPDSYTAAATRPDAPAAPPSGPRAGVRSRRWEQRPENRGYTYRVGAGVDQLLDHVVQTMAAEGWNCTKSAAARALLEAGYQAWDEGLVEIEGFAQEAGRARKKPQ